MTTLQGIQKHMFSGRKPGLVKLEKKLQNELDEILGQEEMIWFQKSREEWIISGEKTTKFYHTSTIVNRARKRVEALKDDDHVIITNKEHNKI